MNNKRVLFVCTGNIFRSMCAEYALKKYLKDNNINGWEIGSAGIIAKKQPVDPKILDLFDKFGVDASKHKQRKLTSKLLSEYDVVIAMAQNHYDIIRSKFNHKNVLFFNELAIGIRKSILDVEDVIKDHENVKNRKSVERNLESTVRYIFSKIPIVFDNISVRFFLFSDFVNGLILHRNGLPFIPLYETKNTLTFMSIDIPKKEDGHILVIPKKRYEDVTDIPLTVLDEIMQAVVKVGKAISHNHTGYNILVNNGVDAGQYIYHTHFHIIPRNCNDDIEIELWKRKRMSKNDFIKLNNHLKRIINTK